MSRLGSYLISGQQAAGQDQSNLGWGVVRIVIVYLFCNGGLLFTIKVKAV